MQQITKYILLLEHKSQRLTDLAPRLKALGFAVLRGEVGPHVIDLIRKTPFLSLVVIDDEVGTGVCLEFLAALKEAHPDLPVIWATSQNGATGSIFRHYSPDILVRHPINPDELLQDLERLLCRHLYPDRLVSALAERATSVLEGAYHAPFAAGETFLKANRNVLGEVNALLPFCGKRVSGRLVVSTSLQTLTSVRKRAFPEQEDVSVMENEDLAGEMSNLVMGRMKEFFERHELSCEIGTPILLRGKMLEVRYKTGRPSLVTPLRGDDGELFIEFCFDLFDPNDLAKEVELDLSESGDLVFL